MLSMFVGHYLRKRHLLTLNFFFLAGTLSLFGYYLFIKVLLK
jgi:hypothetical protein